MSMTEKSLRERFGLGRDAMKQLRERAPAGSWAKEGGNKPEKLQGVLWTLSGVEWLCAEVVKGQEIPPMKLAAVSLLDEQDVQVTKCDYLNKRVLECVSEKLGRVMVKCGDSSKFAKGMKIPVRRDGLGWVVARHPRYKGKM
jgi:hypothetical protein